MNGSLLYLYFSSAYEWLTAIPCAATTSAYEWLTAIIVLLQPQLMNGSLPYLCCSSAYEWLTAVLVLLQPHLMNGSLLYLCCSSAYQWLTAVLMLLLSLSMAHCCTCDANITKDSRNGRNLKCDSAKCPFSLVGVFFAGIIVQNVRSTENWISVSPMFQRC